MARVTPESILEEIWYESRGLRLTGAPIHVLIDSMGLGQSYPTLGHSHSALSKLC
jgi:hypothetical protein